MPIHLQYSIAMKLKMTSLTLIFFAAITAKGEVWSVALEEWPPYACAQCPEGGAVTKALKEALRTVSIDLEPTYFPRVKILRELQSKKYVGYLTWKESSREGSLIPSKCLFTSPLIFVESTQRPLIWKNLKELKGKRIGVMEGSGYLDEFTDLTKKGIIKAVPNLSDETRIRLVSQGKLDGALLDLHNALYHLKHMPDKTRKSVQISKALSMKETFFALQEGYQDKMPTLEKALQNVDTQKIVDEYLDKNK